MQTNHKTCTLDEKYGSITGKGYTGNCANMKSSHRTLYAYLDEAHNIVIKSEKLDIDYTESGDSGSTQEGQENRSVNNVPGVKCVNDLPAGITMERFQDSKIKTKVENSDVGDTLNYCCDITQEVHENVQGTHVLEDNGDSISTSSDGLLLKSPVKIIPDLYEESAIKIKLEKPDEDDVGNYFCDLIEEKLRIKQEKSDNVDMGNYFCDIIDEMQKKVNIPVEHNNYCIKQEKRHDAIVMDTESENYKDRKQDSGSSKNKLDHQQPLAAQLPFKCGLCLKPFSLTSTLHRHIQTTHKRKQSNNASHEKQFQCKTCGKSFMTSRGLVRHTQTHFIPKTYKCQECDKSFTQFQYLKEHLRFHNENKAYKCKLCYKAYTLSCYLEKKPFQCPHFDKTFSKKKHLKQRYCIYTSEKPFKCPHCKKTFSHKGNLNMHLHTHTVQKPFKCPNCEKTFSHKGNLNVHLHTHTGQKPFKCLHCEKTFSHKGNLNVHLRTHTGQKPFKCPHCKKTFAHKRTLKVHLQTHTDHEPLNCRNCKGIQFEDKPKDALSQTYG